MIKITFILRAADFLQEYAVQKDHNLQATEDELIQKTLTIILCLPDADISDIDIDKEEDTLWTVNALVDEDLHEAIMTYCHVRDLSIPIVRP